MSGILQETLLGPLLFSIYINVLMDVCYEEADLFVYADDAKLFNHIKNANYVLALQTDLNKMVSWINDWSLKLNTNNCRVVCDDRKKNIINHNYFIGNEQIERVEYITDLGVIFDRQLNFSLHIKEKVSKAYSR